ncbi:hypothetical protein KP509_01G122300 [Ceratopteris richardii]|nr:hypothetical protein KP509_01G122300 [Ceratopteris richardii]
MSLMTSSSSSSSSPSSSSSSSSVSFSSSLLSAERQVGYGRVRFANPAGGDPVPATKKSMQWMCSSIIILLSTTALLLFLPLVLPPLPPPPLEFMLLPVAILIMLICLAISHRRSIEPDHTNTYPEIRRTTIHHRDQSLALQPKMLI